MAHARRKFVDAVKDDEKQANYVLDEMQHLYALEQRMREQELGWSNAGRKEKNMPAPFWTDWRNG